MKRKPFIRNVFVFVGFLGVAGGGASPLSPLIKGSPKIPARTTSFQPLHPVADYGNLPLAFEPNQGQTDPQVQFLSRGKGYALFITPQGVVLSLKKPVILAHKSPSRRSRRGTMALPPLDNSPPTVLRLEPEGAQPGVKFESQEMLPGVSNYFIGKDPSKWIRGVHQYSKAVARGLYPGVDMVYYGNQGQLEYDFVVQPGADPGAIRLGVDGAQDVQLNGQGDLELGTKQGKVVFRSPMVYQENGGTKIPVVGRYKLKEGNKLGFEVEGYDKTKPLVIDPVLDYSTYLGGTYTDWAYGVAVDPSGDAYVTGFTMSPAFPGTSSPLVGTTDAFITEMNPSGTALIFSDYLGGNDYATAWGIALDPSGDIFVTGETNSFDFPTTSNAVQTALNGNMNAFVAKLPQDGASLLYSTYLGGSVADYGYAIAVDSCENIYVTGLATSPDFPLLNPIQSTLNPASASNAFVTKINAAGALGYSTFLGGSGAKGDCGFAITVDGSDDAWVAGYTCSSDFPTVNPFQPTFGGFQNGFITEVNPAGTAWAYSTYFGGSSQTSYTTPQTGGHVFDVIYGIALDGSRNIYVTGWTASPNFPTQNPIQSTRTNPFGVCFVSELAAGGASLVYSTYFGGTGNNVVDCQEE
ncbi:MAG TPA: SBBP repeat-containing protein, partial [bacterium]|nr:SBBP repeat-containing protein [bacterium]